MMLIFVHFGSLRFEEVFTKARAAAQSRWASAFLFWAHSAALFIGATGKSAQIPLYVWLPDAMEGPTPVSCSDPRRHDGHGGRLHGCALQRAVQPRAGNHGDRGRRGRVDGAFCRHHRHWLQTDIKRVLAYSTVSQLGYMFAALGVGAFVGGIFHLMTHAFFKALLFLGSGRVIMAMHHEQDMMKMGGSAEVSPLDLPHDADRHAGDRRRARACGLFQQGRNPLEGLEQRPSGIWLVAWLGAGMTAFYMFRLMFLTFYGEERMDEHTKHHVHESPKNVVYPLVALAVLSLIGGYVGMPAGPVPPTGLSISWSRYCVCRLSARCGGRTSAGQEFLFTVLSVAIAGFGIYLAYHFYVVKAGYCGSACAARSRGFYTLVYSQVLRG